MQTTNDPTLIAAGLEIKRLRAAQAEATSFLDFSIDTLSAQREEIKAPYQAQIEVIMAEIAPRITESVDCGHVIFHFTKSFTRSTFNVKEVLAEFAGNKAVLGRLQKLVRVSKPTAEKLEVEVK